MLQLEHKLEIKDNNSGFTLVELIVCVLIIAILAGISIPSFNAFIGRARSTEGSLQISSFIRAVQSCFLETGILPRMLESYLDAYQSLHASGPQTLKA